MLAYRDNVLYLEDVSLPEMVSHTGTPVYVYSLDEVTRRVEAYARAFPQALIAYACKANRSPALLAHLAALGCGADVVSAGELSAALSAGIPAERIVVNGNAKTEAEMALALRAGVRLINLDAQEEIPRLAAVACDVNAVAAVALRINPGLDVHTHPHLKVGAVGSHFGIPAEDVLDAAAAVAREPFLTLRGIHLHVGSQICDLDAMETVARLAAEWVQRLRQAGHAITEVDLGGGLGISYTGDPTPTPAAVARRWQPYLADLGVTLIVEPGRWLVGPAGVLLVRVVQVKRAWGRTFVAVDGGMNVLLRPALYGAHHRIWPLVAGEPTQVVDVVGPICESADVLARDCPLPPLKTGDVLAILDVGAYGRSMASTYNGRPLPPEVVVQGDRWWVVSPGSA